MPFVEEEPAEQPGVVEASLSRNMFSTPFTLSQLGHARRVEVHRRVA